MSAADTELVTGIYERWAEGDFETLDVFDPHVVFIMPPDFPDAGIYFGVEGVREYMYEFLRSWDRATIEAEEVIPGEGGVVVAVNQRASGSGSGAVTDFRYFHVWSLRAGKVIRLETIRKRADALGLIGVRE